MQVLEGTSVRTYNYMLSRCAYMSDKSRVFVKTRCVSAKTQVISDGWIMLEPMRARSRKPKTQVISNC